MANGKRQMENVNSHLPFTIFHFPSFPLHLMQRVLAKPRRVLLDLDLLHAAGDSDLGAVVQVTGFGALKPDHFSILFCHTTPLQTVSGQLSVVR
jgi:hypothetical protein